MSNAKRKPAAFNPTPKDITEGMIAIRAYDRWLERGCPLWQSDEDWFAAREELQEELGLRSE